MHRSMRCPGTAKPFFGYRPVLISPSQRGSLPFLRSPHPPSSRLAATPGARWLSQRAVSDLAQSSYELFNYTSGRWLINDALRHAGRKRVFNVPGLCQLAAESVGRRPDDMESFVKLAEGGFNRTFLITMRDGFQMVARIPYPATVPKNLAVASEVATIDLLRSSGLPLPEVYGYSPAPDNAAETEYIFMEFIKGTTLSDVWNDLGKSEIDSVMRELVQLEAKMMSIDFPAGGSLYYPKDLDMLVGEPGVPLEGGRFCVGPDTSTPLWFGRRSQLNVDRGPYRTVEEALVKPAQKELAWLKRFGQPLLPLRPMRREAYQYQKQSPFDHIKNIERYLLIAPSLAPKDSVLCRFRIRHPDLQPGNVIVSRSPTDSTWKVDGLLDWQHTPILPLFLIACIPGSIQNYGDSFSESMIPPSLPGNLENLSEHEQMRAMDLYHSRLLHYHYFKNTEEHNRPHFAAMMYPTYPLPRRLYHEARHMWEGETMALKIALIDATSKYWKWFAGDDAPCPVAFDAEDIRETMKLDEEQTEADAMLERMQMIVGFGEEGWVPNDRYERAKAIGEQLKEQTLAAAAAEEEGVRAEIMEHWFLDDMDVENYM